MRKKYLSALLFGALLMASTATFTSCKDYDDDINDLQSQITANAEAIKTLQDKINNGLWVTSVSSTEGGFNITFSDGQSYQIVNGADGAKGADGTQITIGEDGYWYFDGEKSEYKAVSDAATAATKAPYVGEDGYWYFYETAEATEATKSNYKAVGAAYAVEANGAYTLYIPDANGTMQTIKLPTAASMISGINILDGDNKPTTDDQELEVKYWVRANATTGWEGPRGNIPAKSIVYSAEKGKADVSFNLDPSNIDASEFTFALVNSQDGVAPVELATPSEYKKLITRATYNNGIFTTGVSENSKIYTYTKAASDFTEQLVDGTKNIIFALAPQIDGANIKSPFQIEVNASAVKNNITLLKQVIVKGVNANADSQNHFATIEKSGSATIKVGTKATVTVDEPSNLYDLYMTVTDAAKDKFGLEIDNEARTITATKSPDDLTDATFDLTVYVMDNAGKQYEATTFTVTVNRTMAASTYDKQEKAVTKLTDTFTVPATPLFTSLADQLNDWKESVALGQTTFTLLEKNAAGNYVDATETKQNFIGSMTKDVADNTNGTNGNVTFLTSNNQVTTTASTLANIRFNLNIQQAITNKPLKIDKEYYIRLTFRSAQGTVLNSVIIPFVLTKPELSTILVQESGVFLNGGDLAHAYMYHGDATWQATAVNADGTYKSRYYFDEAFTDMIAKLAKAGMTRTTTSFTVDKTEKVKDAEGKETDYVSTDLARIANATVNSTTRPYIELKEDVNNDNKRDMAGYKKDLNVNFAGNYLDVQDETWKYTKSYQFRIMSPILEGTAVAANNVVEVNATGTTKIYAKDVWAKTYNNDEKYDIFKVLDDKATPTWSRKDIKAVAFSTGNKNVFEMTEAVPTNPKAATATEAAVESYIEVEGKSQNTAKLNVAITDIWGYTLESSVDIKTTLNTTAE